MIDEDLSRALQLRVNRLNERRDRVALLRESNPQEPRLARRFHLGAEAGPLFDGRLDLFVVRKPGR